MSETVTIQPTPRSKTELVDHLVDAHGFSRFDMERGRRDHLQRTHAWRHSVPAGETLSDAFGNSDYGQKANLHEHG
jgi:hypothetical protein